MVSARTPAYRWVIWALECPTIERTTTSGTPAVMSDVFAPLTEFFDTLFERVALLTEHDEDTLKAVLNDGQPCSTQALGFRVDVGNQVVAALNERSEFSDIASPWLPGCVIVDRHLGHVREHASIHGEPYSRHADFQIEGIF